MYGEPPVPKRTKMTVSWYNVANKAEFNVVIQSKGTEGHRRQSRRCMESEPESHGVTEAEQPFLHIMPVPDAVVR